MSASVEAYEAGYFVPTVRAVLDPLLAAHGFEFAGVHRRVTVYWRSGQTFFRVGYLPETLPRYELLLGVGTSDTQPPAPKQSGNSFGVWRLVPADIAPELVDWRFEGPQSLASQLRDAWEKVVAPYVLPAIKDVVRMARTLAAQQDEIREEDEKARYESILKTARSEFEAGRYAAASRAYAQLGERSMTRADLKRAEIARRRRGAV